MSTETESIVTAEAGSRSVRQVMRQIKRAENTVPSSAGKRSQNRRETAAGYGFLLPWLIGFIGLTVGPMIYSLYLAFTKYNLFTEPEWVGLDNFVRMFTEDPNYIQSVQITLVYVLVGTPIKLAAALGVAMLLNYRNVGSGFFRSSFYAPSLIGASVSDRDRVARDVLDRRPRRQLAELLRHRTRRLGRQRPARHPHDDPARRLAVRRADGHLPRGPQADPAGALRGRRGRRRGAGA